MIIRQDVSIFFEVPDDKDIIESGAEWIFTNLRKTDAVDWSCGEAWADDYLP